MSQIIEPFLNVIHRFFKNKKYNSKNWTFFSTWLTELNLSVHITHRNWTLFFNMTQRIEPTFFADDWKNWTFFDTKRLKVFFRKIDSKNSTFFSEHDSRNWSFFGYDSKIFQNMTLRTVFFSNVTQKMNLFLNVTRRISTLFYYDSKNWTHFPNKTLRLEPLYFLNMTQRIETINFWIWLTELNLLVLNLTQRIDFFFEYDSRTWTFFFFEYDAKNWTLFFLIPLKEWNLFLVRLKEVNLFVTWLKEMIFFLKITQRIELFFPVWLTELNFFWNESQNWTFFFWIRLTEMDLFLEYDAKNWTPYFLNMTQRIEPFDFWKWLTELNLLFRDSKNWTFFLHMTQRIEVIFEWLKELNFFIWLKELNFFFQFRLTELNFFLNMTHEIEPIFSKWR